MTKYHTATDTMLELLGELLASPDLSEEEAWSVWHGYLDRSAGRYTHYTNKESLL